MMLQCAVLDDPLFDASAELDCDEEEELLDGFGIAVTEAIESGFITIMTGLPSLSLARTRNDSGIT